MLFRVTSPPPPRLTGAILSGKHQCVHLIVAQASQTPGIRDDDGHKSYIWKYADRKAATCDYRQWIAPVVQYTKSRNTAS